MKLFTYIMAFWMLYLSAIPCGDSMDCSSKSDVTVSATADHQQHKEDAEHCTPFCTCACCAVTTSSPTVSYYSLPKKVFEKTPYAAYLAPSCSEVSYAIWQPPQLS